MKKRILSMLLVIVMVLSMVPVSALATEELKVVSTKTSKYVVIDVDEITLSATDASGNTITGGKLDWKFDPADRIAVVSDTDTSCTIKGAAQGEVTVTVKGEASGRTGIKTLTVLQPPEDLQIVKANTTEAVSDSIKVGDTIELGYTCSNADKIDPAYIVSNWKVQNESETGVLTVSDAGVLTAGKVGTAEVRFAMNGKSVVQKFTVSPADPPAPGKITVTSKDDVTSIMTLRDLTLFANIEGYPSLSNFTWELAQDSEDGVVSLIPSTTDNTCVVKGLKAGTVGIIAKRSIGGGDDRKDYVSEAFTVTVKDRIALTIKANQDQVYATKTVTFSVVDADDKPVEGVRWSLEAGCKSTIDEKTGVLTAGNSKETVTVKAYLNDQYTIAPLKDFPVVLNTMKIVKKGGTEALTQIDANDLIELEVLDNGNNPVTVTSITKGTDTDGALELTKDAEGVYWLKGLKKSAPIDITAKANGFAGVTQSIAVNNKSFTVKNGDEVLSSDPVLTIYEGDSIDLTVWDGETPLSATWYNRSATKISVDKGTVTGVAPTETDKPAEFVVGVNGYDNVTVKVKVLPKQSFQTLKLMYLEGQANQKERPDKLAVGETRVLVALDTNGNVIEGVKWDITGGTGKADLIGDHLTGSADGTVELTAACVGFDPMPVTIKVKTELLENVDISRLPKEMNEGQEIVLNDYLTLSPAYATDKTIDFTSRNKDDSTKNDIVEIVDGKLKAKKFGTAIVTGTYTTKTGPVSFTVEVSVKAAEYIELDSAMPEKLICGESMELKAVLKNAEGEIPGALVQWRLKNDKVIKNLVELTGNKLTAYPQSTYDFYVELEAFIEGNDKVEALTKKIHIIPRTTNIALKKDGEDISGKTTILDVTNSAGVTIDAVIKPSDANQIVDWQVNGPSDIFLLTRSDSSIVIQPVSSQKTGTITVIATAKDGTGARCETTIELAKMADSVVITNAPAQMRGGANIQLRTNLDEDKTVTDRRVEWSIVGGNNQYASVTADGFLDTAKVADQQTIKVKATLIANPAKADEKEILLCPAVNSIKIMRQTGETDQGGNPILANVQNVVDYSEGSIELTQIAYPAGHTGSFEWDSSNKAVADFVPGTSVLKLNGAGKTQITCTATDGSKTRGIYNLEVVKSAGYVDIKGAADLISGKNTTLTATVYTDEVSRELAANQKVTWSVEDAYGNPTKAATINSRGRLYAKTVNYGTEVVVYATSVENKEVVGEHHVIIQPKKARTFAAFLEDDARIIEAPVYMNPNETAVISGQWYIRDGGFDPAEDCTFYSSNPAVAKIDEYDGTLETLRNGSTTITVRATDPDTRNVYTAKFALYVVNTVDHVAISKYYPSQPDYVRSGSYMYFYATAWSNKNETILADNQGITWGVYEENDEGELVATKAAYMTSSGALVAYPVTVNTPVFVVATSNENPSTTAEYKMWIRPAYAYTVNALCMDEDSGEDVVPTGPVNLEVMGENTPFTSEIMTEVYVSDPNNPAMDGQTLYNPAIVWETSNKDIVKVVGGQLYYTGKTGKVDVTPTFTTGYVTYRGNTVTLNIMKFVEQDGIEVSKKYANQELYSGKSLLMYAAVDTEATTRRVTWSLVGGSASNVASINPTTGLIRAKKGLTEQQEITVRATAVDGSGAFGEETVTIYPLATKVVIEGAPTDPIEKDLENKIPLTAVLFVGNDDDQANQDAVKWTSSRSSIVSVDKEGNIIAKRKGTATIKATATDGSGKYATIRITVVNP